jgi:hypothetical protein
MLAEHLAYKVQVALYELADRTSLPSGGFADKNGRSFHLWYSRNTNIKSAK